MSSPNASSPPTILTSILLAASLVFAAPAPKALAASEYAPLPEQPAKPKPPQAAPAEPAAPAPESAAETKAAPEPQPAAVSEPASPGSAPAPVTSAPKEAEPAAAASAPAETPEPKAEAKEQPQPEAKPEPKAASAPAPAGKKELIKEKAKERAEKLAREKEERKKKAAEKKEQAEKAAKEEAEPKPARIDLKNAAKLPADDKGPRAIDFIGKCADNYDKCITYVAEQAKKIPEGEICLQNAPDQATIVERVRKYITLRPGIYGQAANRMVVEALYEIYPCRRERAAGKKK